MISTLKYSQQPVLQCLSRVSSVFNCLIVGYGVLWITACWDVPLSCCRLHNTQPLLLVHERLQYNSSCCLFVLCVQWLLSCSVSVHC